MNSNASHLKQAAIGGAEADLPIIEEQLQLDKREVVTGRVRVRHLRASVAFVWPDSDRSGRRTALQICGHEHLVAIRRNAACASPNRPNATKPAAVQAISAVPYGWRWMTRSAPANPVDSLESESIAA